MGILQEIPNPEQLTALLSGVLGDGDGSSGIGAVLKRLQAADIPGLQASVSIRLDGGLSSAVPSGGGLRITGNVTGQLQPMLDKAAAALNPETLLAPLRQPLTALRDAHGLEDALKAGQSGLDALQKLMPEDASSLISSLTGGADAVKAQLLSGEFAELVTWSKSVQGLYEEIAPLLSGDPASLPERLLDYLRQRILSLIETALPFLGDLPRRDLTGFAGGVLPGLADSLDTAFLDGLPQRIQGLIALMAQAQGELTAGNDSNTAHLSAAAAEFESIAARIQSVTNAAAQAADGPLGTANSLIERASGWLDALDDFDVVDLGNIRDKFHAAIQKIRDALAKLDIDAALHQVTAFYDKIGSVADSAGANALTSALTAIQNAQTQALEAAESGLFAATASARAALSSVHDTLQQAVSSLGSFDGAGKFAYGVQEQIKTFLESARDALRNTVAPILAEIKDGLGSLLSSVQEELSALRAEIDKAVQSLRDAFAALQAKLNEADVPGVLQSIAARLDAMLSQLGAIDLDIVFDPVISQINEFRDSLKKIDFSAMSDIVIQGMSVSASVVVHLDFVGAIAAPIKEEAKKLVEIPKNALLEIEGKVDAAIAALLHLDPKKILAPLDDLFAPIEKALDSLRPETLTAALSAYTEKLTASLDSLSPATLLQPLVEMHAKLAGVADAVSPQALTAPLDALRHELTDAINGVSFGDLLAGYGDVVHSVQAGLQKVGPDILLAPLLKLFDTLLTALEKFHPGELLAPFGRIFAPLGELAGNLTDAQVKVIGEIFAPLRALPRLLDPRILLADVRNAAQETLRRLDLISPGAIIGSLQASFQSLQAAQNAHVSASAGGGAVSVNASASAQTADLVARLNPLRNAALGQSAALIQEAKTKLQTLIAALTDAPANLITKYESLRGRLEMIIPVWVTDNMTPASIRRALTQADPLGIQTEIDALYQTEIMDRLRALDPRPLATRLQTVYDKVIGGLAGAISPEATVGAVNKLRDSLLSKLASLDLNLLTSELEPIHAAIRSFVDALDPAPLIAELDSLAADIRADVAALDPGPALASLTEPVAQARAALSGFDPRTWEKELETAFNGINVILSQIQLAPVLAPINKRLEDITAQLEEGLDRVAAALTDLIAAIPGQAKG